MPRLSAGRRYARARSARRQLVAAVLLTVALALVALAGVALRGLPVMGLLGAVTSYRAHFPLLRDALLLPAYLAYQFPLSLPLALIGASARWLWRRDRAVLIGLLILYLGNALLMLTRHHPGMYVRDQFLFYLASYLPVALLVGLGAAVLAVTATSRRQRPRRIAAALGVAVLIAKSPASHLPTGSTLRQRGHHQTGPGSPPSWPRPGELLPSTLENGLPRGTRIRPRGAHRFAARCGRCRRLATVPHAPLSPSNRGPTDRCDDSASSMPATACSCITCWTRSAGTHSISLTIARYPTTNAQQ